MLRTPDLCRKDLKYVQFNPQTTRCYIKHLKSGCDFSVVYDENAPHRSYSPCDGTCCNECVFNVSTNTKEEALKMFNKLTKGYVNEKLLLI